MSLRSAATGLVHSRSRRFRHVVFSDTLRTLRLPTNLTLAMPGRAHVGAAPKAATRCDDFLRRLLARNGLDPACYRPEVLRRRLPACLRALRVPTVDEANRVLDRDPQAHGRAVNAVLIGATSFFRDAPIFAVLREHTLPALLRRASPLSIWSIACSDGAELYSVAIMLAECGALERVRLIGTDCRGDAIESARRGCFEAMAMREMEPRLRERYFSNVRGHWRIADEIRRHIEWRVADVFTRPEPGPWDLVLCRNLAIYLADDPCTRLWALIGWHLRRGGMLVVGKAERPTPTAFTRIDACMYRRDGL